MSKKRLFRHTFSLSFVFILLFLTSVAVLAAGDFPATQYIKMKTLPQSDRYIGMDDLGGDVYVAAGARTPYTPPPSVVMMLLYVLPIVMVASLMIYVVASAVTGELTLATSDILVYAVGIVIVVEVVVIVISLI